MNRYVVAQIRKRDYRLYEVDQASYTPSGWHRPHRYYTLDDMSKAKIHPAEKRGAAIQIPGFNLRANNVRLVDEKTCNQIDAIDAEIRRLRRERQKLFIDGFLTFPLVKETDLQKSRTEVYPTKQAAIKGYK